KRFFAPDLVLSLGIWLSLELEYDAPAGTAPKARTTGAELLFRAMKTAATAALYWPGDVLSACYKQNCR
ncbi:MAG: hypothetical protein K2P80_13965, partial [Beijerinckiaceae bacterium]|nr:hypothetical protein [Beijerinckiaceae bacterium]